MAPEGIGAGPVGKDSGQILVEGKKDVACGIMLR